MLKRARLLSRYISSGRLFAVAVVLLLGIPDVVFAAGDTGLPYEKGMEIFYESMTGPVPFVISLVGIIGCGAMLIFGGEISGFLRTMVFIILVVAVIVQAGSVVTMLGGKWGATQSHASIGVAAR